MEVLQIVGIGVVGAIVVLILREMRPDMALAASLVTGGLIALAVVGKLSGVMEVMGSLSERAQLSGGYLSTIIRVIGVAYLAEFGSQICRDAGAGSIAAKVELGGKLMILALSAPIVASLVDMIVGVLR
ncbi:MAG: stage III sporulation protein AD [Clostridia bacterium]|nr:stage III sporulation protein AD [Clostridia bacterium]